MFLSLKYSKQQLPPIVMDWFYFVVDVLFSLDFGEATMYTEQNFCVFNGPRDVCYLK